jgi:hypothetical protein
MMGTLMGLLRRWLTQDVARTNAAQASVRLKHRRRQIDDLDAFLAAHHHHPARRDDLSTLTTDTVHSRRDSQRPH